MMGKDQRAVEAALPVSFRGRAGYKRMLDEMTLRVSVTGIRGKSALTYLTMDVLRERGLCVYAKQTGTDPVSIKDGLVTPIERDPRKKAVLEETYWEMKKHWPFEACVLENQGITGYTMRTFNKLYCRPHYLLLTNIRRDHLGDIARRLPNMAKEFVRSAQPGTTIVSGERSPKLRKVMHEFAQNEGIRFLDAAPGRKVVPGFEGLTVLDAMLRDWMGQGLTRAEMQTFHDRLEHNFQWRRSAVPGIRWFHGGEINDVDSTKTVLGHLQRRAAHRLVLVAYFRKDRPDRTSTFVPFLHDALRRGVARHVVLVGHRSHLVAKRLRRFDGRVHVLQDDSKTVPQALRLIAAQPAGTAVFTVANAVPPWPRRFAELMDQGDTPASEDDRIISAFRQARTRRRQARAPPTPAPTTRRRRRSGSPSFSPMTLPQRGG